MTLEETKLLIHTTCPACKNIIKLVSPPQISQQIICPVCQVHLAIVWLYPISLDYAIADDQLEQPTTIEIKITEGKDKT